MNELAQAIRQALAQAGWQTDLLEIYRQADQAIAAAQVSEAQRAPWPRSPTATLGGDSEPIRCLGGGCCCRFDLQEHRLYASTLELALLCRQPPCEIGRAQRGLCPYQQFTRCQAHPSRPLGCRTFFCRDRAGAIQSLHEPYHRRIVQVHERFGVTYLYAELCAGLLQFFASP